MVRIGKKWLLVLVLFGLSILIFSFSVSAREKPTVGFASFSSSPVWIQAYRGLVERSQELGLEPVGIIGEAGFENEIKGLEKLIQQQVDVLVISGLPLDKAEPIVEKAKVQGIKCVGMQTNIPGEFCNVAVRNVEGGVGAVYAVLEFLRTDTGVVALFEYPYLYDPINMRGDAIETLLRTWLTGIVIEHKTSIIWPHNTEKEAYESTKEILAAYPEPGTLDVIITPFDDDVGTGIARALVESGRTEIGVSGIGTNPEVLRMRLEQGVRYSTVDMGYIQMGRMAAEIARKLADGAKEVDLPWITFSEWETIRTDKEAREKLDELGGRELEEAERLLEPYIVK